MHSEKLNSFTPALQSKGFDKDLPIWKQITTLRFRVVDYLIPLTTLYGP
jgi:hypothetical protein